MSESHSKLDLLERCYTKASEWLRFAEAKNGALIAVASASIFAVTRYASEIAAIHPLFAAALWSFYAFMTGALTISLLSFIPRLYPPYWIQMGDKNEADNPLFFRHACKYSRREFSELLDRRYGMGSAGTGELELDLCDQIVNNSRIALIKFGAFEKAAWLFLIAVLTPIGAFIVWLVWR